MSPSELAAVAGELRGRLLGAVVQKAHAPLPRLAYLELRVPGRSVTLCLSAEPRTGRLSVARARFPSPKEPLPFQQSLRRELSGAKLEGLEHADRVVTLLFRREGLGRKLIAELGGALLLATGEDRLLALSGESSPRLKAGARWEPPPAKSARSEAPSRLQPKEGAEFPLAEAAEALAAPEETAGRAEEIRRLERAPLKAKLARLERTLGKVRAEAGRGADAEEHRRLGELLSQNLHRLPRGSPSVRLTEYTEEGPREREVPLDPKLSPKEEAERHFHQYRRLLRGVEHAQRRLQELGAEAEATRRELDALDARSHAGLLEKAELLEPKRREAGPPRAQPYKEYASASGEPIWVGKGAEGNDALTFRHARPHHLWLHARGWPGSHVVIPLGKGAAPSPEWLLDAAHLALHHSGAKGEAWGEVAYTQVKFVRKQKGAGPGQVSFTRERTLGVRVEPERIRRLLASGTPR